MRHVDTNHFTREERETLQISAAGISSDYGNHVAWWRMVYDAHGLEGVKRKLAEGVPTYEQQYPRGSFPKLYNAQTLPRIAQINQIIRGVVEAGAANTLTVDDLAKAADTVFGLIHGDGARGDWHPVLEARRAVALSERLDPKLVTLLAASRTKSLEYSAPSRKRFHDALVEAGRFIGTIQEQSGTEAGEILERFGRNAEGLGRELASMRDDVVVPFHRVMHLKVTCAELLFASTQLRNLVGRSKEGLPVPTHKRMQRLLDPELKEMMLQLYSAEGPIDFGFIGWLQSRCSSALPELIGLVAEHSQESAVKKFACEHFLQRFLRFHGRIAAVDREARIGILEAAQLKLSAKEAAEALGTARRCFK